MTDPKNILFLDIETVPEVYQWSSLEDRKKELWEKKMRHRMKSRDMSAEEIYEEAGILSEFGKIICICVGFLHGDPSDYQFKARSFAGDDEQEILKGFTELCNKHFSGDEHFLCGHNGKEFDFPYIARRCIINGLPLPHPLNIAGKKPWEVKHLDTMELWKFGDFKNYTSLELLSSVLGIPTPKGDISGSDVARVYYEEGDLDRIVQYCHRDVIATAQVYLRLQGKRPFDPEKVNIVD